MISGQNGTRDTWTTVPTLIAYFGPGPEYLDIALRSADDFHNQVILIGDDANRGFWKHHADSGKLETTKYDAFTESFVKMSDYPDFYETAFWRRPFAVESWMRSEGLDRVFLLDSD